MSIALGFLVQSDDFPVAADLISASVQKANREPGKAFRYFCLCLDVFFFSVSSCLGLRTCWYRLFFYFISTLFFLHEKNRTEFLRTSFKDKNKSEVFLKKKKILYFTNFRFLQADAWLLTSCCFSTRVLFHGEHVFQINPLYVHTFGRIKNKKMLTEFLGRQTNNRSQLPHTVQPAWLLTAAPSSLVSATHQAGK